jgi:cytochrome b
MSSTTVAEPSAESSIRVWDPVVRLFHWSLVAGMAAEYLLEAGTRLHERVGYVLLALIGVRVLWGLVGTRHARFADWLPTPGRVRRYLAALAAGRPSHTIGHNPVGAIMILALLGMVTLTAATGWLSTTDAYWGVEWVEDLHEVSAWATLALIPIHVGGVMLASLLHKENLVLAMITGRKRARA